MPEARVHRLATKAPDDVSALLSAIDQGDIDPKAIIAILGKTEGNGCVNDFTRAFAVSALKQALNPLIGHDATAKICMVMSGGTEGALSPHLIVFERLEGTSTFQGPSLAIGQAHSGDLPFSDLGRMKQVTMVAETVGQAMTAAGLSRAEDVHFVQIKCPLLTADRVAEAASRGETVATRDTLKSMGLSRGACALGVAVALGEIALKDLSDDKIGADYSLYSSRASTSGGVELLNHEVVVMGMSANWSGPLSIDHAVMADQIDLSPVGDILKRLGFSNTFPIAATERHRLVALLAKAEAGTSGSLRNARHTMLDDSDISSTRHARAFVGGALAGLTGMSDLFVSGGAEHQGPDGGGPVAIIARKSSEGARP